MPGKKFNLVDHVVDIMKIAATNNYSHAVALQCFIANLSTMTEHYKGASVDYYDLGTRWNSLTNNERVMQKKAALDKLVPPANPKTVKK